MSKWNKKLKASFTVEASVVIPVIFFVIAFCMQVAMDQYSTIRNLSEENTKLEEILPVKIMWDTDGILKGLKNEN